MDLEDLALPPREQDAGIGELLPTALAPKAAASGGPGTGKGLGTGPGRVPKLPPRREELAKLAATTKELSTREYTVLHKESFHYMLGPNDHLSDLDQQIVRVRVLVNANGRPIFMEALSGPAALHARTLNAVRGWWFSLSPKAKAQAPVMVVLLFKFGSPPRP